MFVRVVISGECTWSDRRRVRGIRFTLPQILGRNRLVSFVRVMSLDTLLEAAKFLESSTKGTTKDDSAIARGTVE